MRQVESKEKEKSENYGTPSDYYLLAVSFEETASVEEIKKIVVEYTFPSACGWEE